MHAKYTHVGYFFPFDGSLWLRGSYMRSSLCMEADTHRTFLCMEATYAIKNQRKAQNTPNLTPSLSVLMRIAMPCFYIFSVQQV